MYRYGVLNPTNKETEGVRSGYMESGATGEYAGDEDVVTGAVKTDALGEVEVEESVSEVELGAAEVGTFDVLVVVLDVGGKVVELVESVDEGEEVEVEEEVGGEDVSGVDVVEEVSDVDVSEAGDDDDLESETEEFELGWMDSLDVVEGDELPDTSEDDGDDVNEDEPVSETVGLALDVELPDGESEAIKVRANSS
ncbi:uncharacterized protein C8R40DRAFT_1068154 [Lentinula edodes]|uniref:uncharacterized protein n=1 Tax=Lentinula edodes TaxID=5353 RepID=UPI001E8CA61F|nr:uncharacterized protein C8R40DRAFT_1068154 [Lentinula edodes]KAH7876908.1 hypothetical protein C8R40DRAFT_1068154 [Lentinula edodes]